MGSLNDGIKELIEQLKTEDLPCTRASKLHVYVANALREKDISLYEAYLIKAIRAMPFPTSQQKNLQGWLEQVSIWKLS